MKKTPKKIDHTGGSKTVKAYTMTANVTFTAIIKARNQDSAVSKFQDALLDRHLLAKPRTDWNVDFSVADAWSYRDAVNPEIISVEDTDEIHATQILRNDKTKKVNTTK